MNYLNINSDEMDAARNAVKLNASLWAQAKKVIDRLAESSRNEFMQTHWGISVMPSDDGQSAVLDSPFGVGRAEFKIHLDGRDIFGRYEILRKDRDKYDIEFWRPVWAFRITKHDLVEFGDKSEKSFEIYAPDADSYGRLLLSIAASLGK